MSILDFIFYSFIVVVFIQALFYFIFFERFAFLKQNKSTLQNIPVSVIICAKNEAENLKNFLPSIISQDYSNFEIIKDNPRLSQYCL